MKNRFQTNLSQLMDALSMRVYTSRLLGQDADLVLHGGGNTSVKIEDTIYVKASGWDLATIEPQGFAPVETTKLQALLQHTTLSDAQMVALQRQSMTDQSFPNPSVEAILHATIPFDFVDHTHADAIVTISNSIHGEQILRQLYPPSVLILPYIMPGFQLAKQVSDATQNIDWNAIEGIILLNHGIFTFSDDAKWAYDKMIEWVNVAERYLIDHADKHIHIEQQPTTPKSYNIDAIVSALSAVKKCPLSHKINHTPLARTFAQPQYFALAQKGVLTPEHIIRTKRAPVIFTGDSSAEIQATLEAYAENYSRYFQTFASTETMLDPYPNWGILPNAGTICFGKSQKDVDVIEDINNHTMLAMLRAEQLGGYQSLSEQDSFAMEYWELEQMKLKK